VRHVLRKAIQLATPNLRELAEEVGMTYHSLRRYAEGARTPSPPVMRRIVAALRRRGAALGKLADELERAAAATTRTRRKP
jgi:transcriptional regulator with XRE-family HTH domain